MYLVLTVPWGMFLIKKSNWFYNLPQDPAGGNLEEQMHEAWLQGSAVVVLWCSLVLGEGPLAHHRLTWHSLSHVTLGSLLLPSPQLSPGCTIQPQLQHCAWDQSDCRGGAVCAATKRLRGWTALGCKVGATHTRSEGKYRGNLNKQHDQSFQRG